MRDWKKRTKNYEERLKDWGKMASKRLAGIKQFYWRVRWTIEVALAYWKRKPIIANVVIHTNGLGFRLPKEGYIYDNVVDGHERYPKQLNMIFMYSFTEDIPDTW